jgi:hypothetical protein
VGYDGTLNEIPFHFRDNKEKDMETKVTNLENHQQMEAVVQGPNGANRLIICNGIAPIDQIADAGTVTQLWTWLVGPVLTHTQFQRAICTGALIRISHSGGNANWSLVGLDADWDDESGQVEVRAEIQLIAAGPSASVRAQGISYHVSILGALEAEPVLTHSASSPTVETGSTSTLVLNPPAYDFGRVPVGSKQRFTVTVTNTGNTNTGPVQIVLFGRDQAHFSLEVGSMGWILPPGAFGGIGVNYQPSSPGPKTAALQLSASPGGLVAMTLIGST